VQIVSLVEEGDGNKDGVLSREEHGVLMDEQSEHIKEVMMSLQTEFMRLMAEGRDESEM
jgi:hypothetical protein